MILRTLILSCLFSVSINATVWAQDTILTAETVLQSSAQHYPEILGALQAQRASIAAIQQSEGAFDATVEQNLSRRFSGFYDGQQADTRVVKPIPDFNSSIYGGYRVSDGTFPIYEDVLITNEGGEFLIGAQLSLLRNSFIDARRAAVTNAKIDAEIAELDVLLTQLTVQLKALEHYWRWVANGQRLAGIRSILELMEERQRGLEQRAKRGDVADIFLTENQQYITQRRNQIVSAEQILEASANALALFYRDDNGTPIVPTLDTLPLTYPRAQYDEEAAALLERINAHPLLLRLQSTVRKQEQELALGENLLLPKADLSVEFSNDSGERDFTRIEEETIAKLSVSIPLQRNLAKGRISKAKAEMKRLEYAAQLREDELRMQLTNTLLALEAASERTELAQQEMVLAKRMTEAERQRFQKGDSDLFLINTREQALVDATMGLIDAHTSYQLARAQLNALTLDHETLKIIP